MEVKFEIITPEIAKKYLELNKKNYRKMRSSSVNMYADDMKNGRWEFNGEGIKFAMDGTLLDGQHRLAAIVKSNVPVEMMVVYGVDSSVSVYDVGTGRTNRQILMANNFPTAITDTSIIGAANILITKQWSGAKSSKSNLISYFSAHQDDWVAVRGIVCFGSNHPITKKSPVALACYCLYIDGTPKDTLSEFFEVVNTGFPIQGRDSSPAIVLRNFLIVPGKAKLDNPSDWRKLQYSMTISAFRDFESGKCRKQVYKIDPSNMKILESVRERESLA